MGKLFEHIFYLQRHTRGQLANEAMLNYHCTVIEMTKRVSVLSCACFLSGCRLRRNVSYAHFLFFYNIKLCKSLCTLDINP